CPDGWVGFRGVCYFLSEERRSWDQGRARCSELGAPLAVLRDEEMEFLVPILCKKDHWLGLRRRGEQLQWEDGSSFNSSFPVHGNAECVFLAEDHLGCEICSTPFRYICSKPQTRL
ncbi:CD69 protein, partial [Notiomystis cincta]|nr:CD69 protein [Notiomystis cincta]